ncbi:MAG: PDZ domain-containing protein [Polyangiaceae bacterium]
MRFASSALLALALGCAPAKGTIGAVLSQDADGHLHVVETPPGLAAQHSGLQPGDEIILVDGVDVRRLSDRDLRRALGGEVGQNVRITALRGEEVVRVTLKRTEAKRLKPRR